jgi:hypothetical protein
MQNNRNIKILAVILFTSIGLSGCSTYPNKFKCGDAKGLGCTMLRDVDVQIDSGQIEEAYKKNNKCRGTGCNANALNQEQGLLRLAPKNRAQTYDVEPEISISEDETGLYF